MEKHATVAVVSLQTPGPALVLMLLITAACGTGGHLVSTEQIAQIKVGVSTKQEVRAILGEPRTVTSPTVSGVESETWFYPWAKYSSDPHTGVPPVGVAGSFPISRAHRKTTEIGISFDVHGIVKGIEEVPLQ